MKLIFRGGTNCILENELFLDELKSFAKEKGISNRVDFHGYCCLPIYIKYVVIRQVRLISSSENSKLKSCQIRIFFDFFYKFEINSQKIK